MVKRIREETNEAQKWNNEGDQFAEGRKKSYKFTASKKLIDSSVAQPLLNLCFSWDKAKNHSKHVIQYTGIETSH
jgi:hypothetical protein